MAQLMLVEGEDTCRNVEAHAAARWARVLVSVIDSPADPRTMTAWARLVFAASSTLGNWCRMAGVSPRRSLVFARLLRATVMTSKGQHKLENVLDVVDRRTLVGLLKLAGLDPQSAFPENVDVFLQRQKLVHDRDGLREIKRALIARSRRIGSLEAHDTGDDSMTSASQDRVTQR